MKIRRHPTRRSAKQLKKPIPGLSASAAETITFRGQAEKFVTSVDGDVETFTDMLPDETRTVSLTLKNEDSSEMKFYMSAEILDNIASKTADSQAVYDFVISKNGQPFFTTIIGGGTAKNTSAADGNSGSNGNGAGGGSSQNGSGTAQGSGTGAGVSTGITADSLGAVPAAAALLAAAAEARKLI